MLSCGSIPRKGYVDRCMLERLVSWAEGTRAELGFEQNVSEFIIILSLRGTEQLEAKSDGIGDSTGRGPILPRSKRRWGAKYEGLRKEALFRAGKRGSWRG